MDYIQRSLEPVIKKYLKPRKAVIILGARRVGKTELIKQLVSELEEKPLILNGEDENTQLGLEPRSVINYTRLLGKNRLLIIDEAQAIPEIGLKLKLMLDSFEDLRIIATGSSVFDLNNELGEPLVGRKITLHLHPLAQDEFKENENSIETRGKLEERLIYGGYPELEHLPDEEERREYLKEQINSYLLKDILAFEGIKKRDKIVSLLRMIAFRVGSEISIEGLANELQMSKATVDKYLDLLSKVFIIHKVSGFSRNLDNEITKMKKWYFYDNGIRNGLIHNFNSLDLRNDQGQLWENYLISERLKLQEYTRLHSANYFWRTHTKQEIDWIEDRDGELFAYEFKWNSKKGVKIPTLWANAYPNAHFMLVNPSNYLDFITS